MATDYYDSLSTNATYTQTYGTSTSAVNPGGELDSDAFMKLLLAQLQYQDPTDPMDSETILSQTSQLATLESASNTNTALEKLTGQLSSSTDLGALNAIGKMASLGSNSVTFEKGDISKFEVYFEKEILNGTLSILDSDGKTVRTVSLAEQAGQSGVLAFQWDGSDNDGNQLESGYYSVKANYIDPTNTSQSTQFGIYPVESVRYDSGTAYVKLGSSYVPFEYITEFF